MRNLCLILCLLLSACAQAKYAHTLPFSGSIVALPTKEQAANILSRSDAYTKSFTRFDLQGRLQTTGDAKEGDYLRYAALQALEWNEAETDSISQAFKAIQAFLTQNNIRLKLPDTILVVRTTGKEEFGAEGYTRGNTIILSTTGLSAHLVAHELFHVFSRYNTAKRDLLYAALGFTKCKPISYSDALKGRSITNPDCPVIEHYLSIPLMGADSTPRDVALILYSDKDYNGGDVFGSYLKIGLLQLDGMGADKKPLLVNGEAKVIELDGRYMGYLAKLTGANTGYLLHPEEISAEHFSMLVTGKKVPNATTIEKMKAVLQQ